MSTYILNIKNGKNIITFPFTELRFIFEVGNTRVEELDDNGEVTGTIEADWGTIEGYFEIWKKEGVKKIKSIEQLKEVVARY